MATAATKTKRIGLMGNIVPLRASLVSLQEKLKAFKVATPDDTARAFRSSPINDSPIAQDIELIFKSIVEVGGLKPYELAFSIDTADLSNPIVKELSKEIKGLKTALLTHLRQRAKHYGLPTSYVQSRQRTKILVMGPEL